MKEIYLKEASDALEEKRIAELALVEAKKGRWNLSGIKTIRIYSSVYKTGYTIQRNNHKIVTYR